MTRYLDAGEGWMDVPDLDRLAEAVRETRPIGGGVLELGVWKGLSTSALTAHGDRVTVVDTFRGTPGEGCEGVDTFADFRANMQRIGRWPQLLVLRMDTTVALERFVPGRLRVALHDASHEEADVYRELGLLWPKMLDHGHLFVDDYDREGVTAAVDRFLAERPEEADRDLGVSGKLLRLVKRPA